MKNKVQLKDLIICTGQSMITPLGEHIIGLYGKEEIQKVH
ncbi:hypothetical protein CRYO30217_02064 [Parvicella tangerina]|uniref:Uncharacterized protein n=1 Tax=Parvicella tangerina TaxID=2829795 RepID=A0A916JMZ7_9FLAO|nr:hypothetical protein CRYO30217_02064 [Parvicella tangerina]